MSRSAILSLEQQQLCADQVGRVLVDLGAEEHDALLEQPLVDLAGPIARSELRTDGQGVGPLGYGNYGH